MANQSTIEFVDSVPRATRAPRRSPWGTAEAAVLRAHPHQIAIIDRAPAQTRKAAAIAGRSGQIRIGRWGAWIDHRGDFAAWVRTVDGETRLYAQYVPHSAAAESVPEDTKVSPLSAFRTSVA